MPLSRQVVPVDQAGRENLAASAPGGSLRSARAGHAAGGRPRGAVPGRLAAAAPRWRSNLVLTAESYRRARIVVEHVLAPELAAPLTLLAARYA